MPTITFSAPVIILIFIVLVVLGGGATYLGLNLTGNIIEPLDTPTQTQTPLPSTTPTIEIPTLTLTPLPTPTPLSYQVQPNDTCIGIAYTFNISVQSIVLENGLSADCVLSVGTTLRIPHPTPTATPLATNTPSSQQATIEACEKIFHVVQENETLSLIAIYYEVPVEYIMEWSGKTVDTAFLGETLTIPLCLRSSIAGATVTPSPAPEYPAPELLRPRNGEAFTLVNSTITLQWAAVSELRENEFYLVTVVDITNGQNDELMVAVTDTKFIVPEELRPTDNTPHIFRWSVVPVAQVGINEDGSPRYREGGPSSQPSYFSWVGAPPQNTPQP
jgi:LysM repeat protein